MWSLQSLRFPLRIPFAKGFWGKVILPGDGFRSGGFNSNLSGGAVPGSGISTTITDVRVEANDINSATLRWTYSELFNVKVYRSTDNIFYTLVDTVTSEYPASTHYTYVDDGTLDERTLYYYKLTDDDGATFTEPVHVVSYLIAMGRGNASTATMNLPQAFDEVTPELYNQLVDKINLADQGQSQLESTPCDVCSVNGALIIDCTSGCEWFRSIYTEEINSISLIGCDGCPPIDLVIAPGVIAHYCGWPNGCDFDGDECFQAPIPGGPDGRVAKTSGITVGGYWNAGKPGLNNQSCPCPLVQRSLMIQCCSGSCTLDCNSNSTVRIKACGGLAPYTWAASNLTAIDLSATTGTAITVSCKASAPSVVVQVACVDAVGVTAVLTLGNCGGCGSCVPGAVGNTPTTSWCTTGPGSIDNETICVPSGTASGGTAGCALLCCPEPYGTYQSPVDDPPPCNEPYLAMTYNGASSGSPKTGLLLRTRSSTDGNTTGIGFIIDESDSSIKVYQFENESIATGGTLVLSGTSQGPGLYEIETNVFGSDAFNAGYFYMAGPSGDIFDGEAVDNFWATNADAVTGMGSGGGLLACVWGAKVGSEAQASWSAMGGLCAACYVGSGATFVTDPTCTQTFSDC